MTQAVKFRTSSSILVIGAGALQRSYRARSVLRTVCKERVVRKQASWMMEKWCALDENDSLKIMMQASCISCSDVKGTSLIEKASFYWEATKEPA
jgi:siroheme synthase (precorrin-2 oxidase/ferrochelatase)